MWEIYEHRKVSKQLSTLPTDILKRYEKWKDIVRISGPSGLKFIKGFHDETLRGEWKGHRSSGLSIKYRIIYRVVEKEILVQIINITPYDYRRN